MRSHLKSTLASIAVLMPVAPLLTQCATHHSCPTVRESHPKDSTIATIDNEAFSALSRMADAIATTGNCRLQVLDNTLPADTSTGSQSHYGTVRQSVRLTPEHRAVLAFILRDTCDITVSDVAIKHPFIPYLDITVGSRKGQSHLLLSPASQQLAIVEADSSYHKLFLSNPKPIFRWCSTVVPNDEYITTLTTIRQ